MTELTGSSFITNSQCIESTLVRRTECPSFPQRDWFTVACRGRRALVRLHLSVLLPRPGPQPDALAGRVAAFGLADLVDDRGWRSSRLGSTPLDSLNDTSAIPVAARVENSASAAPPEPLLVRASCNPRRHLDSAPAVVACHGGPGGGTGMGSTFCQSRWASRA